MIEVLLIGGHHVIIDETNLKRSQRYYAYGLAEKYNANITVIELENPGDEELRRRCDATGFRWEIMEFKKAEIEKIEKDEVDYLLDTLGGTYQFVHQKNKEGDIETISFSSPRNQK
jgi:predicted kinase